jgi:ribosomal RNA-processing protein 1
MAELSLAKRLAHSSDPRVRAAATATLSKWLSERDADIGEYLQLWKAVFYAFWHSDKVPVQQELALNLSRLVRVVSPNDERVYLFLSAFFTTMQREWGGIDKHRVDKYLSLLRRMLYEALRYSCPSAADAAGGTPARIERLSALLSDVLSMPPNGPRFQLCETLLDELCAAVPDVTSTELVGILTPFFAQLSVCSDRGFFDRVVAVFDALLERTEAQQHHQKQTVPSSGDAFRAHGEGRSVEELCDGSDSDDAAVAAAAAASAVNIAALLQDQQLRQVNAARALQRIDLAPIASRIFAVASDKATLVTHRSRLFQLHSAFVDGARRLRPATSDEQLYPPASLEPRAAARSLAAPAARLDPEEATAATQHDAHATSSKRRRAIASLASEPAVVSMAPSPTPAPRGKSMRRAAPATAPAARASSSAAVQVGLSIADELLAIPSVASLAAATVPSQARALAGTKKKARVAS